MAKMSEKNLVEFRELSAFIDFFATHVMNIPETAEHHPSRVLETLDATRSQLLRGLRQATNDFIEMTSGCRPDQVEIIDACCHQHGAPTLTEIRRRYWTAYGSIIKRQRIRDETEYYLVAGLLADQAAPISSSVREHLRAVSDHYESRVMRGK